MTYEISRNFLCIALLAAAVSGCGQQTSLAPTTAVAPVAPAAKPNPIDESQRLIVEKRYQEAIAVCERGLAAAPNDRALRNNLAVARLWSGEVAVAERILTPLVAEAPDFKLAANNLKWAQSVHQQTEATIAAAKKTVAKAHGKDAIAAYWTLGLSYAKLNQNEDALKAYEELQKLDPSDARTINNAGATLMSLRRPAEALVRFQEAAKLDPKTQLYANNVRWAQSQLPKS